MYLLFFYTDSKKRKTDRIQVNNNINEKYNNSSKFNFENKIISPRCDISYKIDYDDENNESTKDVENNLRKTDNIVKLRIISYIP